MQKFFKLSAERMRIICGVAESRIFRVTGIETNMIGGAGFDAFVTLDSGDGWYKGAYMGQLAMFAARGEFVTEAEYLAQDAAPAIDTVRAPITVSLAKRAAPECVAHLVNITQESNAAIMARAVAFVRDVRLTAEYLAAHDGDEDDNPSGVLNHYTCYACAYEWSDEWDCGCDDDCPECGARHCSPHTSEEVKA